MGVWGRGIDVCLCVYVCISVCVCMCASALLRVLFIDRILALLQAMPWCQ